MTTTVYTDGACLRNPGPGGWAWAIPDGRFQSGAEEQSTNQRMEITAVLEALRANDGSVHVISDSTYVVNCFRDGWWEGWLRRDWKNAKKQPVANRDLWEPLVDLYRSRPGEITFEWVKGHADDPTNDIVDRLAVEAARNQEGRSGTGVPEDLGPPDEPEESETERDPRLPRGRLLVVAGLKPPDLGGYEENPTAIRVREHLAEILRAKAELHPDLFVVTGLNLGTEQLGAEAAAEAGVPYVVTLAYPDLESVWPPASQQRFRQLCEGADRVVHAQRKEPEDKSQVAAAFRRRDGWLASQVDEALVVWDHDDKLVGKFVDTLEKRLGEDEVWIVDPTGV